MIAHTSFFVVVCVCMIISLSDLNQTRYYLNVQIQVLHVGCESPPPRPTEPWCISIPDFWNLNKYIIINKWGGGVLTGPTPEWPTQASTDPTSQCKCGKVWIRDKTPHTTRTKGHFSRPPNGCTTWVIAAAMNIQLASEAAVSGSYNCTSPV